MFEQRMLDRNSLFFMYMEGILLAFIYFSQGGLPSFQSSLSLSELFGIDKPVVSLIISARISLCVFVFSLAPHLELSLICSVSIAPPGSRGSFTIFPKVKSILSGSMYTRPIQNSTKRNKLNHACSTESSHLI